MNKTMKKLYNICKSTGRRFSATVLTLVASLLCATSVWASFTIGNDIWLCNDGNWSGTFKVHMWKGSWTHDIDLTYITGNYHQAIGSGRFEVDGFCITVNGTGQGNITEARTSDNCFYYTNSKNWGSGGPNTLSCWNLQFNNDWLNQDGYASTSSVAKNIVTSATINGFWAKGWFQTDWLTKVALNYQLNGTSINDYDINGNWQTAKPLYTEAKNITICDLLQQASIHNPGSNTLTLYYKASHDGTKKSEINGTVTFTLPGFAGGSNSINFGNVKRGAEKSSSLATAYTHYGTTLTTSNCSIGGTHASMFNVTSISESNVTVRFAPPAGVAMGSKSATLTITDAHGKTKTISLSATVVSENDPIVLIADTAHISDGPTAVLQGYLKQTGCVENINRYGFKYAATCAGVESGTDVYSTVASPMKQGAVFSKTISSGLTENTTYYYKAYIYSPTAGTTYSSDCEIFTTRNGCNYATGDTIYYTINASAEENDDCALVYKTFEAALTNLKSRTSGTTDWYSSSNKLLKKHIVFQVAPGTYGTSGSWIDFSQINYYNSSSVTTPTKYFIIRPLKVNTKPIVYGMKLADSRWITVDGMNIKRDNTTKGLDYSAILIGQDSENNALAVGSRDGSDWRIKFINCEIEGKNFCSIHANGVDGFYMENCNLVAAGDANTTEDTFNWGASIKFMNSKNIVMLRNNFKGAHANNIFAQNVRNMLVMNNVFWNDNAVKQVAASDNYKAIIRLINYSASDNNHKVQNIGMYYNTMYIAENTASGYDEPVNFLCLGGVASGSPAQDKSFTYYDFNTIDFMYNNCYSYDTGMSGRPTSGDKGFGNQDVSSSTHLAHNNFWSQYDTDHSSVKSGFAFGSDADFVNVKDQVCKTAANTPEGLVVKGTGLNRGSHLTADRANVTYAGNSIDATSIYDDRLKFEIRPRNSDPWTLGAYQQALPHSIDVIIWNGGENNVWDNRNNWVKPNGQLVTCTDILDENLQVIIPSPNSEQYPLPPSGSITHYPYIPEWDDENIPEEGVRIGSSVADKFANKLELEYGAALLGTEHLASTSPVRYVEATAYMEAGRNEWILIGNMVRPFTNDTKTSVRNINSGDYFIAKQEPHVYMQHVVQDGTSVKNGVTFTSLEQTVSNQSAYMIRIPDQYGPSKLPASIYYSKKVPDKSKLDDASKPKTFTFNGKFAADAGLPSYTGLSNDGSTFNFVSNYYTANLDIKGVLDDNAGWGAKYYNYSTKSWVSVAESGIYIKPQAGFILVGTGAKTVTPAANRYVSGNTAYKSASADDMIKIGIYNTFDNTGSVVYIKSDGMNADKAFGWNQTTPELYVISNNRKYDLYVSNSNDERIPLGIRNSSGGRVTIKFKLEKLEGFDEVILEDAKENMTYNLAEEQPIFNGIPAGDLEGRFFLNIGSSYIQDITSATEEVKDAETSSITIFCDNKKLTVSASPNSKLQTIVISDMSGRSWTLQPGGSNYSEHYLPVAAGVYTVRVVSDKITEVKKVIVK